MMCSFQSVGKTKSRFWDASSIWFTRARILLRSAIFHLLQVLLFRTKEEGTSTREDFGKGGFKREESYSVDQQPRVDTENCAPLYVWVVGNYQHTAAVKYEALLSLVEMVFHFWRSGGSRRGAHRSGNVRSPGKHSTNEPWRTNVMNNILRIHPKEQQLKGSSDDLREINLLRS